MPTLYPPESVAPWPPPWNAGERPVTLSDSWTKVAGELGIPAMDLIEFNFNTRIPETINWYMLNKMGCTLPTPDGKNFRFGRKPEDPPKRLVIYRPPAGWSPYTADDNDEKARQFVIRTLLSGTAAKIHFNLYGDRIWPGDMASVASYVLLGKIYVRYDSANHDKGRYTPTARPGVPANRLMIGFVKGDRNHRALIAHEATHAIADVRGASMSLVRSEAVAYTAQALWLLHEGQTTPPTSRNQEINAASWKIAVDIFMGGEASPADVGRLYAAVGCDPDYRGQANPHFDGL